MRCRSLLAVLAVLLFTLAGACSGYNEQPATSPGAASPTPAQPVATQAALPSSCPQAASPVPSAIAGVPAAPPDAKTATTPSGLQYIDLVQGNGTVAQPGQMATVNYTGWLTDGKKFDSSLDRGQPFSFPLGGGQVIRGWDEGVAGMHIGGKRRLIVPPNLGYGPRGGGGVIPPCATLIFDVELLGVK